MFLIFQLDILFFLLFQSSIIFCIKLSNAVFRPHTAIITGIKSNLQSIYTHEIKVYTEAWQITHLYSGSNTHDNLLSWNVYSSAFPNLYKTMPFQKSTLIPRHIKLIITTVSNIFFILKTPLHLNQIHGVPQIDTIKTDNYLLIFLFLQSNRAHCFELPDGVA